MAQIMNFHVTLGEHGSHIYEVPNHGLQALEMFAMWWRHFPSLCDASIIVEEQPFSAHRAVLMACSDFFRELYRPLLQGESGANADLLRKGIRLSELSAASFSVFLEYAYTGKLDLSMRSVELWLQIGIYLKVSPVQEATCQFLMQQTNSDNCMDVIAIAEKFELEEIKRQANRAMCDKLIQLSQSIREERLQSDQDAQSSVEEDDDGDFDEEQNQSDAENQNLSETPVPRQSPRKHPLHSTRQTYYPAVGKVQKETSPLKVETKAALKGVFKKPVKPKKLPAPRAPSQRAQSIRQRALRAKREAIGAVTRKKREYSCKFCGTVVHTHQELKMHYRKEHAKCTKCRKVFQSSEALAKHLEAHKRREEGGPRKRRTYICEFCGKNCHCNSALKMHVKTHTGEKPFACHACPKRFIQSINLKRHVQSYHGNDKPYACSICGKRFSVLVYLKSHETMHSQDRPFQCEECGALFKRKSDLHSHRRVHTAEKPYGCDICFTKFKTTNDLKAHMMIHNDKKPHVCTQCGASFKRSGHLNRHSLIHTKKKPHTCDQCGAQFNRKENLRSHQRIHSGEFPYSCKVCKATFRHLSSMKIHEKTHTVAKPSEKESSSQIEDTGILMQLMTAAGQAASTGSVASAQGGGYRLAPATGRQVRNEHRGNVPVRIAPASSRQVVKEHGHGGSLRLAPSSSGRQIAPLQLHISSANLQELTGGGGGGMTTINSTHGGIDINLVNLATGTLTGVTDARHTPSPHQVQTLHQLRVHQQHDTSNIASPALLTLSNVSTDAALAQVQAEAQAQIQAHFTSGQSAPLQLTHQLQQQGQHAQNTHSLLTMAAQGPHHIILQ